MDMKTSVAVVGATGAVGREILGALEAKGFPADSITLLASERSEGEEVSYNDESLEVEKATADSFRGVKVALFAIPAQETRSLALAAQAAGAWVVDVSGTFRTESAPLLLPRFNAHALQSAFTGRIVSTPSAVTTALMLMLEPLRAAMGVREASVTALMGASLYGASAVTQLERQTADLLSGRDPEVAIFPHRLGFNVIPQVGEWGEGGYTSEEHGWSKELARLWAGVEGAPFVSGTAFSVPTFFGHTLSVHLRLRAGSSVERVQEVLKSAPGVKLLDIPEEKIYPMPSLVTGDDSVLVGRVRAQLGALDGFHLVAAIDNVGRGAALNAVEAAELLLSRG